MPCFSGFLCPAPAFIFGQKRDAEARRRLCAGVSGDLRPPPRLHAGTTAVRATSVKIELRILTLENLRKRKSKPRFCQKNIPSARRRSPLQGRKRRFPWPKVPHSRHDKHAFATRWLSIRRTKRQLSQHIRTKNGIRKRIKTHNTLITNSLQNNAHFGRIFAARYVRTE